MYTAHQACAYGSSRPKWTVLAHNRKQFFKINRCCPGESPSHKHKPWGLNSDKQFATSEETAYPIKLAGAIAEAFGSGFAETGWRPPVDSLDKQWTEMPLLHARVSAGYQPKASKIPPIVPEHKIVVVVKGSNKLLCQIPIQPMQRLKKSWKIPEDCSSSVPINEVPSSSQLLRTTPISGQKGGDEASSLDLKEVAWGIPYEPHEFVSIACQKGHPKNFEKLATFSKVQSTSTAKAVRAK